MYYLFTFFFYSFWESVSIFLWQGISFCRRYFSLHIFLSLLFSNCYRSLPGVALSYNFIFVSGEYISFCPSRFSCILFRVAISSPSETVSVYLSRFLYLFCWRRWTNFRQHVSSLRVLLLSLYLFFIYFWGLFAIRAYFSVTYFLSLLLVANKLTCVTFFIFFEWSSPATISLLSERARLCSVIPLPSLSLAWMMAKTTCHPFFSSCNLFLSRFLIQFWNQRVYILPVMFPSRSFSLFLVRAINQLVMRYFLVAIFSFPEFSIFSDIKFTSVMFPSFSSW